MLGYFYRVGASGRPCPTVIATNGYGNRPERAYGLGLVKNVDGSATPGRYQVTTPLSTIIPSSRRRRLRSRATSHPVIAHPTCRPCRTIRTTLPAPSLRVGSSERWPKSWATRLRRISSNLGRRLDSKTLSEGRSRDLVHIRSKAPLVRRPPAPSWRSPDSRARRTCASRACGPCVRPRAADQPQRSLRAAAPGGVEQNDLGHGSHPPIRRRRTRSALSHGNRT